MNEALSHSFPPKSHCGVYPPGAGNPNIDLTNTDGQLEWYYLNF